MSCVYSESLKKLQRDLQEIETKTTKVQERIDFIQSQLEENQDATKDFEAVEIVQKEISNLVEEKKSLEKQIQPFQQEVDYEKLKTKQQHTQVFIIILKWLGNERIFLFSFIFRNY